MMLRTEGRKVSGGGSNVVSSTSTTSPISSTSRLTAPSAERTTTFMTGVPGGAGPSSRRRRKLTAQIDRAADHTRRKRDRGHIKRANDLLNALQFHSEQQLGQIEGAKLRGVCHG